MASIRVLFPIWASFHLATTCPRQYLRTLFLTFTSAMSSSSATGISSRSPSPTTPEASDDLHLVAVQDEDYPWLTSSPVPRPTSWDNNKPIPYSSTPHIVPSLCLQDLIHDSTLEEYVAVSTAVTSPCSTVLAPCRLWTACRNITQ